MTALVGNFSLSMAVLVSLVTLLTAMAAARFESTNVLRAARAMTAMFFVLLTLASAALMTALTTSDFRFEYVVHYTEKALPVGYKLAAFWAGQEGSLLLWAWLLAAMSTIALFASGKLRTIGEAAAVIGTLAVVCCFFATLMLFAANPFKVAEVIPADGHGLNPMLQDPGMIAHPPLLFLGYAGYTIPFALLVGALVAGRKDNEWILATRRWALVSWLFLSVGILLGAQWAYVELGWGGYWAWDPVENASLLPWLTGTALLHSIVIQQHRGMFKKWNASLLAVTFILCIFGTYLTRSGVIQSVHSFGDSPIGTFFLVFLTISVVFSIAIIAIRSHTLKSEQELAGLMGKEGFFLATNVLLVGMMVITLYGTMRPLISRRLGIEIVATPEFYNNRVVPLGLILAALMAVGPLLVYSTRATRTGLGKLLVVGAFPLMSIVAIAIARRNESRLMWAWIAAAIAAYATLAILVELGKNLLAHIRTHDEDVLGAILNLIDSNHRRYGGQIAHVGVLLIVVGIVGSSLFNVKENLTLKPNESVPFAGRTVTLLGVKPAKGMNYDGAAASLLMTNKNGSQLSLEPQIRRYDKAEQLNSEVSIRSSWREDVYVTLASVDETGSVTIQAIINPLVSWIWTGGIIMTLGGTIALLPRLLPHTAAIVAPSASSGSDRTISETKTRAPLRRRAVPHKAWSAQ